ncbi:MAG: DUF4389 domain-containing protein [Chitinophagaceae bacterium]|nr:DUF4389 domain-containing protein [Oligoflexus sp.]
MTPDEIKTNVKNQATWERALPMLVYFAAQYFIVQPLLLAIMLVQFFAQLLFLRRLVHLYDFSVDLSNYSRNLWLFLTYTSDRKIFPYADWRESSRVDDQHTLPVHDNF